MRVDARTHLKIKNTEIWNEVDFMSFSDTEISNLFNNYELKKNVCFLENPSYLNALAWYITKQLDDGNYVNIDDLKPFTLENLNTLKEKVP